MNKIEQLCLEKDVKLTSQRKVIAHVLSEATDHPDVEEVYLRAHKVDERISLATVYRTIKLFENCGIVRRLDIGDGKARYEEATSGDSHHHHLIDLDTGDIIEFYNEELEELKSKIAHDLGYKLVDHRLELYGKPLRKK